MEKLAQYLQRAEEALIAAARASDTDSKRSWERVAEGYRRIAAQRASDLRLDRPTQD